MRQLIFTGVALLALSGCSSSTTVSPNDVAAAESALTAAEILARQYTQLPACPLSAPLCADPKAKGSILADDNAAYGALMTLRATPTPTALTAFQVALAAFQGAIPAQPK